MKRFEIERKLCYRNKIIIIIFNNRGVSCQHGFMYGCKQWSNDINESNYNYAAHHNSICRKPGRYGRVSTSHLLTLKALPRQWVPLETANLQSLRSRMLTSVSPFSLMSLLMVSMYLNFGLPLGITPSTTMSSTVLVVWLSSRRLTCPYQRSRFCIRCVAIGWTVAASLISSFLLCSLMLTPCIHRNILISVLFISISSFFFIVQHSAQYSIVGLCG